MNNRMNSNHRHQSAKCIQCATLLAILNALDIDVNTPKRCNITALQDMEKLKTRKEVIAALNIDASTYTRWVKRGILVPRVFGTRHFYAEQDLERAYEESARRGKR